MDVPSIFELNEIGEATGQVYVYCNEACAESDPLTLDFDFPRYSHGVGPLPSDDARCCRCGRLVAQEIGGGD